VSAASPDVVEFSLKIKFGRSSRIGTLCFRQPSNWRSPLLPCPPKALLGAGSAKCLILIYGAQSLRGKILMSKNLAAKSAPRFQSGRAFRPHNDLGIYKWAQGQMSQWSCGKVKVMGAAHAEIERFDGLPRVARLN